MNFLSHYYFDQHATDHQIMGSLLPDLIKNAVKEVITSPLKYPEKFQDHPNLMNLLKGWERHVLVDKYFHNTTFFTHHTQSLKRHLLKVTEGTPIRTSFLAHISLELILDHLLIKENLAEPDKLYAALSNVPEPDLRDFLQRAGVRSVEAVLRFNSSFISSKYLISYRKVENLSYALNRICMRLWPDTLPESKILETDSVVQEYILLNQEDLLSVFNDTESWLDGGG